MKTCLKCGKQANVDLGYTSYCDIHFLQVIIKRVRKHMIGTFDFKKTYSIIQDQNTQVAEKLLEKIYRGKLKTKRVKTNQNNTITTHLLEDVTDEFVSSFLEDKEYKIPKGIHPFIVLLRKEFYEVARIFNTQWEVLPSLLDDLEKAHPGTKFATLKSLNFFEENSSNSEKSLKTNNKK